METGNSVDFVDYVKKYFEDFQTLPDEEMIKRKDFIVETLVPYLE